MEGHVLLKIFQNSCVSNNYCSVHGIMVLKKTLNLYVLSCHCLKMTIRINVIFFSFWSNFVSSFLLFWVMDEVIQFFSVFFFFFFQMVGFFLHHSLFSRWIFFKDVLFLSFFFKAMCVNLLYFFSVFKCRFIMNLSLLHVPFVFIGYTCISLYF